MIDDAGKSNLRYNILYENQDPQGIEFNDPGQSFSPDHLAPVKERRGLLSASRWNVGAQVSPTYLSPNLKTAAASTPALNNSESAVLSYTGGVNVSYKMNSRLSFQTGLYYSSMGRMINDLQLYGDFSQFAQTAKSGVIFSVETSMGEVSSTNRDIYIADATNTRVDGTYSVDNFDPVKEGLPVLGDRVRQSFEYLEIPLILRYKLIDKKIDFNILGGMSYNFLVGNEAVGLGDGFRADLGSTPGMESLLLSSSVGMSMEYNLNKNLSFNFEPRLRYYLNSDGNLSLFDNPYTIGVFSGLFYNF
jgi:hypothetical protein